MGEGLDHVGLLPLKTPRARELGAPNMIWKESLAFRACPDGRGHLIRKFGDCRRSIPRTQKTGGRSRFFWSNRANRATARLRQWSTKPPGPMRGFWGMAPDDTPTQLS